MAAETSEHEHEDEDVEIAESLGLSLFEWHAEPRATLPPGTEIDRKVRTINSEITCPICLGLMRNPVVVMECLHRFCSECIEKCLRLGRKECPSCRIHVPSRRSLRLDTNFDCLIRRIYPNLQEYEDNEAKLIEDLNRTVMTNNAFTESCQRGLANQLRRRKSQQPAPGQLKRKADAVSSPLPSKRAAGEGLVHFILKRHPQETLIAKTDREFLRTAGNLKMEHLKKFVTIKVGQKVDMDIVIVTGDSTVALEDGLTLNDVKQHFWDGQADLVLHYQSASPN